MTPPDWRAALRDRLTAVTGDPSLDAEIVDELAEDLAQRYDELSATLGESNARAAVLAEIADGTTLRAAIRAARARRRTPAAVPPPQAHAPWLADLSDDVRYACRLLARAPGFSLATIVMLALGIGAVVAVFSVVDGVLLQPLPYPSADRLVAIWEIDRDSGTRREPAALPDLHDLRERARRLDAVGGVVATELTMDVAGEPSRVAALHVTHDVLPMLGIAPVAGRTFTRDEEASPAGDRVLVSERLAGRLFESARRAIGRTIRLDDAVCTILGVVPDAADTGVLQWLLAADYARGFADRDPRTRVDVWLPLDGVALSRDTHPVLTIGRLAPAVALQAADQEVGAVMAALERAYPSNKGRSAHLEPFATVVLGTVRPALWSLLLAVGLVLLGACVNAANLLLVRGTARLREVALRSALGAVPARITRQFVAENAVLAAIAAGLGIAIAYAGVRVLIAVAPADVPRLDQVTVNGRALLVALAIAVGVAIVFGLVPVLQTRRADLQRALASEGRSGTTGSSRARVRSALVVGEIALAVVLTVGAGLMIRSLMRLTAVDAGFRTAGVLKAEFQLPSSRYPVDIRRWPNLTEVLRFDAALLEEASRIPGVAAAALASVHPLDGGNTSSITVVGREAESRHSPEPSMRAVSAGYFKTLGVALVRGRVFGPSDDLRGPAVVVINEAAARRFFDRREPIGQQIAFWGVPRTVIGIVANERFHGLARPASPALYLPRRQNPMAGGEVLLLRVAEPPRPSAPLFHAASDAPALAVAPLARAAIARVDPALAVFGVEPLTRTLSESVGQRRFVMQVLTLFAAVALLLATIGIHAVLSYDVAQRRREIGIRLALGAAPARVTAFVVRRGVVLAGAGLLAGIVGSLALTRLLATLLFEVAAGDVATIAGVATLLGGATVAATVVPARRIVRTDPLVALRDD